MANIAITKKNLLTAPARVQVPWVKVTIGDYTFGVFDRKTKEKIKNKSLSLTQDIKYPTYVRSLSIIKINGQVNQYTLQLHYPVTIADDPNLIEKVISSVSFSRKIVFSYGDASIPSFTYREEEAIITGVTQQFNLESGVIEYTFKAVSGAVAAQTGSFTFINSGKKKPSDEIKRVFKNPKYGLQALFPGLTAKNWNNLIAGDDLAVTLESKTNISPLDYILYLVGCMVPASNTRSNLSTDIYILTIHDDSVFDAAYQESNTGGAFFKVTRVSSYREHADAYEIDIGFNTPTSVLLFSIDQNENYSIFYDYNSKLSTEQYSRRLNNKGEWEDIYSPMFTSGNTSYSTRAEDISWFSKMTRYPIAATIKLQGLLRPATLMQYVRLNVLFPGGKKHISSGLYIVTKQLDEIGESGYFTTLSLTRIGS